MNQKEFMKQVSAVEMPDVIQVKKHCQQFLHQEEKLLRRRMRLAGGAVLAAVLFSGLILLPKSSFAQNVVGYFNEIFGENGSNDLVYRQVEGGSVSLEKGQTVNILAENGKEYNDVVISRVGKDWAQKIGDLGPDMPYTFTAEEGGEFAIYAGAEDPVNITQEITVEYTGTSASAASQLEK